jgi:hypothetical protein
MFMSASTVSLFRLRVLADSDPGTIARVVERFQNLNILPRRVLAEFGIHETLHIEVDVCGMPEEQIRIIAAKIREATSVVSAHWHRVQ